MNTHFKQEKKLKKEKKKKITKGSVIEFSIRENHMSRRFKSNKSIFLGNN